MKRALSNYGVEFFIYAGLFGAFMYLGGRLGIVTKRSVWNAALDGLVYASLMTAFLAIRSWRRRRANSRLAGTA